MIITMYVSLVSPGQLPAQSLDNLSLIAWYPLTSTPNDSTGNYPQMWMTNVPYQDGGIYCNGVYNDGSHADACDAQTPNITALSFRELAVSAEFKINEYPTLRMPVVVCHPYSWRWLYVFIDPDSTIGIGSGSDYGGQPSTHVKCSLEQWHTVTVTWDSLKSEMTLFFDQAPIDTLLIPQLQHGGARRAGITHGGVGRVFNGWFRNLKIYSNQPGVTSVAERPAIASAFRLEQNYPNPFNATTTIRYQLSACSYVNLAVLNVQGQVVQQLADGVQPAGNYRYEWDASGFTSGVYFYRLIINESETEIKKLVLMK